jgi:bilin biosynthesis protein
MDKRFANLFGLTEEEAITLLDTPLDQLQEDDSRYVAAAQLVNFPTDRSINALIRAVQNTEPSLDNRIVQRKAVESLGRLQAIQGLPVIRTCLADEDCYMVENAVWAIGEIGTQDSDILEAIAQLLEKSGQTYRVIIQTLAKLDYKPALERIRQFVTAKDEPTASAAIATVCRFTGDYSQMKQVVAFLYHSNVYARRLSIQDLIDTQYYDAIPQIAQCPVSVVFRLRGIRLLAEAGIPMRAIAFSDVKPALEQVIADHPKNLKLVHEYDQVPTLESVIDHLYETDFGRCYLATQTLLDVYSETAGEALLVSYVDRATTDYGAHYHFIKLLGWLKYAPAYELILEALHNPQPQFQKSRMAAAIALSELGDPRAVPVLKACLETKIWDLKYAALMALEKLGDTSGLEIAATDENTLVQAKAKGL